MVRSENIGGKIQPAVFCILNFKLTLIIVLISPEWPTCVRNARCNVYLRFQNHNHSRAILVIGKWKSIVRTSLLSAKQAFEVFFDMFQEYFSYYSSVLKIGICFGNSLLARVRWSTFLVRKKKGHWNANLMHMVHVVIIRTLIPRFYPLKLHRFFCWNHVADITEKLSLLKTTSFRYFGRNYLEFLSVYRTELTYFSPVIKRI